MSDLEIKGLDKSYRTQSVLRGLDLGVKEGSIVSILGPSGSGKTTLLRVIAGFDRADRGTLRLGGIIVDDPAHFVEPNQRRIGYVPQDGSLFPHLSVVANVGFGLVRRDRRGKRVQELLEMVGLSGLGDRFPHQLSGGQQQRVALARGLAINPDLVLLDEPFSSLDASLRASVRHDVRAVLKNAGTTAILVTHDQSEALSLADQVAIIEDGQISQCESPADLYARPSTPALARELGEANFLHGVRRGKVVETPFGRLALDDDSCDGSAPPDGSSLLVLVRPEQITFDEATERGLAAATVLLTEFYGHDAVVKLRPDFDESLTITVRTAKPTELPLPGARVGLEVVGPVVAWNVAANH